MYKMLQDAHWLREQYVDRNRTLQDIGNEVGCTKDSVQRAMKRHGIERRKRTVKYQMLSDREWLYNAYVVEQRNLNDIAREVNSTPGNVAEHMKQFGIGRRSMKEAQAIIKPHGRFGEKAAHWKGGRRIQNGYVFLYAPWHPTVRSTNPYVQEHRLVMEAQLGRFLEPYEIVHHLDGNRQNNDLANLVIKLQGQHTREHFRDSHEVLQLRRENALLQQRVQELEAQLAKTND